MEIGIQHKDKHLQGLSNIFWHDKDFPIAHKVAAGAQKLNGGHMMAQDARKNGPMFLRSHSNWNFSLI